jgi:hypothetical protein
VRGEVVREWSDGILQARDLPRENAESPANGRCGGAVWREWRGRRVRPVNCAAGLSQSDVEARVNSNASE